MKLAIKQGLESKLRIETSRPIILRNNFNPCRSKLTARPKRAGKSVHKKLRPKTLTSLSNVNGQSGQVNDRHRISRQTFPVRNGQKIKLNFTHPYRVKSTDRRRPRTYRDDRPTHVSLCILSRTISQKLIESIDATVERGTIMNARQLDKAPRRPSLSRHVAPYSDESLLQAHRSEFPHPISPKTDEHSPPTNSSEHADQ